MRYIANENGYLLEVSFGAIIQCNGKDCTAYTGGVPAGYSSLADWFTKEADKLHRWYIKNGELTLDPAAPEPPAYEGDGDGGLPAPESAAAGQYIRVKAVDGNGTVLSTEAITQPTLVPLTQAEYDALDKVDDTVLYMIVRDA